MAKTSGTSGTSTSNKYEYQYKKDYTEDWDIHRNYISSFDAFEAMLIGQVYDTVSNAVDGSKITDSYAATLAIERAARVVGKLPDGVTEAVGKADEGKAAFMDILRQKWIYPNANAQRSFRTKLRLWQLYSSVYGYMPMFYDWNVSPSGYVGPDCWLWNPRNLVPQQGRVSISDMDYVTALTWVSKKFIDGLLEKPDKELEEAGWDKNALIELGKLAENETTDVDQEKDSLIVRNRTPQAVRKGICLATRYESGEDGRWVTFAPDHSCVQVRDIANPHKNGKIPFVIKYSQPLFDSFYGLGDLQRAKPLQFARDGLTNLYFRGIKMNLIPPLVVNANGVVPHTIDYREGAVMLEKIPNSIRSLVTSTAGLNTYQGAMSALTGSLLAQQGSQNAATPGAETLNPSQGKTPAAINLYSDKEATRDGQEREYLEDAVEELTDGFNSLVVNIGTEDIPVALFSGDIQDLVDSGYKDLESLFENFTPNASETGGEMRINPEALQGVEYRFNINRGSTAKQNQEAQLAALENVMTNVGKFQNIFKDDPRVDVNFAEMMKASAELTGLKNVAKFITVKDAPSPQEQKVLDENAQLQQQVQELTQQVQEKQSQENQPTINGTGMYADPHVGAAADAVAKL